MSNSDPRTRVRDARVQAKPTTSRREASGEVPGDWEVAPKALVGDLLAGEIPHLTWGRSTLAGVLALSIMLGLAGLTVIFGCSIPSFRTPGPAEAGADPAPTGEAVAPFDIVGEGSELWREGAVDTLATSLDGPGPNL
jgi:hypothetical protein